MSMRSEDPTCEKMSSCEALEIPGLDAATLFNLWEKEMAIPTAFGKEDEWLPDCSEPLLDTPASVEPPKAIRHLKRSRDDGEEDAVSCEQKSKKQRKRDEKAEKRWQEYGHLPRVSTARKYAGKSKSMATEFKINKAPSKAGGYSAKHRDPADSKKRYTLAEVLALGLVLVPFQGYDQPIVDKRGRVLAVMVPPPDDPRYRKSANLAFEAMMEKGDQAGFKKEFLKHKRGEGFAAINVGLSYGLGHTKPSRPDLRQYARTADALLGDKNIQRLAAYQDASYAFWHPGGYRYYKDGLDKLWKHHPEFKQPNFPHSILPTVAFNIGRNVCTFKHIDAQNCPFGWCCVTALGKFNHRTGGHIILWDLGIVLEFPAGACVCLPSALILHSNIPVCEGEERASFTQYCPGEIFRYVENDFSTDTALKKKDNVDFAAHAAKRDNRLSTGYEMFSFLSHIRFGNA